MDEINDIIIAYLDGSATQPERVALEAWLRESQAHRDEFSHIRDMWLVSRNRPMDSASTEAALSKLTAMIDSGNHKGNSIFRWKYLYSLAAALLLMIVTGFVSYMIGYRSNDRPVMSRLITADGSKGCFLLPDSSVVWLNSGSRLEYAGDFTSDERRVILTGEAYFEVKRDTKRPFVVATEIMDVRVLGTHFLVESYPHRNYAEAVLVEGSVEVGGHDLDKSVLLRPGELLSVDKATGVVSVDEVVTYNYTSWIDDKVVFDNALLGDIILNLEKWFVVEIDCPEELKNDVRLSFSLHNGESLDDILHAMTLVAPVRIDREPDIIRISPQ